MKTLVRSFLTIAIALLFMADTTHAQQTAKQIKAAEKAAVIKDKITSGRYTFVAQYALPMRGGQRYLTSDYDLKVRKDSVIAELPYFGRVYMNAPMNPDEAGINFTSTKFDYVITDKKKGGWDIVITLHDVQRNNKLRLDVYADGTATLQALSNTRDQIRFTGYIKEGKGK